MIDGDTNVGAYLNLGRIRFRLWHPGLGIMAVNCQGAGDRLRAVIEKR